MGCIMLSLLQIPFHFILLKKLIFVAADVQNGKYNRVVTLINGWLEEQQQNVFFIFVNLELSRRQFFNFCFLL